MDQRRRGQALAQQPLAAISAAVSDAVTSIAWQLTATSTSAARKQTAPAKQPASTVFFCAVGSNHRPQQTGINAAQGYVDDARPVHRRARRIQSILETGPNQPCPPIQSRNLDQAAWHHPWDMASKGRRRGSRAIRFATASRQPQHRQQRRLDWRPVAVSSARPGPEVETEGSDMASSIERRQQKKQRTAARQPSIGEGRGSRSAAKARFEIRRNVVPVCNWPPV